MVEVDGWGQPGFFFVTVVFNRAHERIYGYFGKLSFLKKNKQTD